MTVPSGTLSLAGDFPTPTLEEWQRLALGVLRKSGVADDETPPEAVDALLATTTYDDLQLRPLYTTATAPGVATGVPGLPPYTRGGLAGRTGWDVRQRHDDPEPKATNAAVLADLENGVTSVWLTGVAPEALAEALDGVLLDLAPVILDAGPRTWEAATAFLDLAPGSARGNLGADPMGRQARTGEPADLDLLGALATRLGEFPGVRAVTVDATPYHDAGGGDADELAYALATGVAYLRALTSAGLSVGMAFGQLEFRYAATADQFATIAKLRAARRVWARVAQVSGVPDAPAQLQHAVTSSAMMTARDPWVNMLRTTLACFGAGVGGAGAVTVQPFDARLGLPDAFTRRIARNTQTLLVEEAHVARVVDPAGGSWYVEALTEALAQAAWERFVEVERAGGMAAALSDGLVAERLAATWARRTANLAHRRDPLTGVSEFPNLTERLPVRLPAPAAPSGGLPRHRYAEAFEELRDRADEADRRPTVFLATLGPVATHTARAMFATNLFAAGGITTIQSGPVDDVVAAMRESGATVVCLCSSDRLYAERAAEVAAALKAAGATKVWLAGRPGDYPGVDDFLFAGCDALRVLHETYRDLGLAR